MDIVRRKLILVTIGTLKVNKHGPEPPPEGVGKMVVKNLSRGFSAILCISSDNEIFLSVK